MAYELIVIPLTTNFVADTRQRKQLESSNIAILLDVFNKTIIALALVEYEIVVANSYPTRARGIIVNFSTKFNHLTECCLTHSQQVRTSAH